MKNLIFLLISVSLFSQSLILPGQTYTATTTNFICSVPLMENLLDNRKELQLKTALLAIQFEKVNTYSNMYVLAESKALIFSNTATNQADYIMWLEKKYKPDAFTEWWNKYGPTATFILGIVTGGAAVVGLSQIIQITVIK